MTKRARKETIRGLPVINSAAAPPGPWTVVLPPGKPRRRRGPEPGTVDRYGAADRELYADLKQLMDERQWSATRAARELANAHGKVEGVGASESRARRLANRYLRDSR
jgi:hypothetical protein